MTHWSQKNYNGNKEYLDKTNNENAPYQIFGTAKIVLY